MSINFNLLAKAHRKSSPLKRYEANLAHKQGLTLNDKQKDDKKGLPVTTSDHQVSEK